MQRTTRLIRYGGGLMLAFMLLVFGAVVIFSPQILRSSTGNFSPFISGAFPTSAEEVVPSSIPQNSPEPVIKPTMTSDVSIQAAETAISALAQTSIPTPIGADYLQIAYASTRTEIAQIYLTHLLADEAMPITNMPGGACQPSWSPDGTKLVFTSPCPLKKDTYPDASLYIINADGSGLTPLPTAARGDFEPAWSPEGKSIVFTSQRDGYMQIYSYNLETENLTRLVRTDQDEPARQPSWSSDGERIIYAYKRVVTYEIWMMNKSGDDEQQLYSSGDTLTNSYPIWLPDGEGILFNQTKIGEFNFPNLFSLVLSEGASPIRMSLGVISAEDAQYSPDGIWLAYESGGDRGHHVYYSTPSGGNQDRITDDVDSDDFDPAWRPITTSP